MTISAQAKADKKWAEKNPEHRRYLSSRSSARSFIRTKATKGDLLELKEMIEGRLESLDEEQEWLALPADS